MDKQSSNGVIIVEEQGRYVRSIVDYIKHLDKDDQYYIISGQTNFSKVILLKNFISPKDASRFVLIMNNTIEIRGKALMMVFLGFGGYWKLLTVFKFLPRLLLNIVVMPVIYCTVRFFCSNALDDHYRK